jgi:hypothetical protein
LLAGLSSRRLADSVEMNSVPSDAIARSRNWYVPLGNDHSVYGPDVARGARAMAGGRYGFPGVVVGATVAVVAVKSDVLGDAPWTAGTLNCRS